MSDKPAWQRYAERVPQPVRRAVRVWRSNSRGFEGQLTWIFGSPRSGSTWLMNLLGEHEAVVPIIEPLIGWYLGPFLCDLPGADATALDESTFTMRRVQSRRWSQFFSERFADVWVPALARMMRERFYAEAVRLGPSGQVGRRAIVIQEPNGSQSADVIMRTLPRSRLLFLLRDGRDVVDSELAANLEGSWVAREFPGFRGITEGDRLTFIGQSAQKWLWRTDVVQTAFARHPGPKHLVRYEDLLAQPHARLGEIFDWLGLETSRSEIDTWVERHDFRRAEKGASGPGEFLRSARQGSWRENLRPDEKAILHELLAPKLRELGYQT